MRFRGIGSITTSVLVVLDCGDLPNLGHKAMDLMIPNDNVRAYMIGTTLYWVSYDDSITADDKYWEGLFHLCEDVPEGYNNFECAAQCKV